jgi:hypothetical protein
MFEGPPLPLSPDVRIEQLLTQCPSAEPLGAWVRLSVPRLQIYRIPIGFSCRVLASPDLGFLLSRCEAIALREGGQVRVLPSTSVIHWRALQVATATPHLPGLRRLKLEYPEMQMSLEGLLIPIRERSAEEVLGRCLAAGIRVMSSRVVYRSGGQEEHATLPVDGTAHEGLG